MAKKYPFGEGKVRAVSTDWLEERLDKEGLQILDVQPDIHDYITSHIPGATFFNQRLLRIPKQGRPGVYVAEGILEKLFGEVGLEEDRPVVVYTGTGNFRGWGDGLEQTMVAYTLARFGHNSIYLLDGGFDKWEDEDRPVTKEFPEVEKSNFNTEVREDYFIGMEKLKELKDKDNVILLDARPPDMYKGQSIWIKPGHIPGAVNLPWKNLMDPNNTRLLKPTRKIKNMIEIAGITEDHTIICSCGTGREATNEFILFKWYFGYPDVKIYEGSFTEWTTYPDNPVVTGEKPY